MVKIPEKIPEGFKYYLFTYVHNNRISGGGFVGSEPDAVHDIEPLCRHPEIKNIKVREVTREEFIADINLREKNIVNKNWRYFGPETYKNL